MTDNTSRVARVVCGGPDDAGVGIIEIQHGAETYITVHLLRAVVTGMRALDADPRCGAIVVRSEGKHFCAGRDWQTARDPEDTAAAIYETAPGLLSCAKPWIAELTGGSIGVGMGLALCADYRVAAESAYLWPKFVAIGIHHGFGLTATLPWLVGAQRATEMLSRGRRISTPEALTTGLIDHVVPLESVREAAHGFAAELAGHPREALQAIKRTMRSPLFSEFERAIAHEQAVQRTLYESADFQRETGGGYRYRS